jgi:hypothetical protein
MKTRGTQYSLKPMTSFALVLFNTYSALTFTLYLSLSLIASCHFYWLVRRDNCANWPTRAASGSDGVLSDISHTCQRCSIVCQSDVNCFFNHQRARSLSGLQQSACLVHLNFPAVECRCTQKGRSYQSSGNDRCLCDKCPHRHNNMSAPCQTGLTPNSD